MNRSSEFNPNWVSAPGDTISDILLDKQLTVSGLVERMNSNPQYINELITGSATIDDQVANQLSAVLGGSSDFWLKRESQYRSSIKRIEEEQWLNKLPIRDMVKYGWIDGLTNKVKACLDFFGVSDISSWTKIYNSEVINVAFRASQSYRLDQTSVLAWMRQGEIQSQSIKCALWNKDNFQEALSKIRSLTKKKTPREFIPELTNICAKCGVALVIVRAPNGCPVSGATRFLNPERAMIMLSFRHLTDDQFWFTFFHEAAHLILHNPQTVFIDGDSNSKTNKEEIEANDFAANLLVPSQFRDRLVTVKLTKKEIIRLAIDSGVSAGIIVGQLQHLKRVSPENLNYYKRRYKWEDILTTC